MAQKSWLPETIPPLPPQLHPWKIGRKYSEPYKWYIATVVKLLGMQIVDKAHGAENIPLTLEGIRCIYE